jgi:hypothetical protein
MDVAGQCCQLPDPAEVILAVQDGLVKVGDAPPMRDVVPKQGAQPLGRLAGVEVNSTS